MQAGASGNERPTSHRQRRALAIGLASVSLLAVGFVVTPGLAGGQGPGVRAQDGFFGQPFEEPTVGGRTTGQDCIKRAPRNRAERRIAGPDGKYVDCKPAAASSNLAWNGKIPYWNALESTENIGSEDGLPDSSIVFEFGATQINDQSRVLQLGAQKKFTRPSPVDGGANPNGNPDADPLIPGGASTEPYNDGAMFCADQNWLPDGRLLTVGGTMYSNDPGNNQVRFGPTELQGLRNSRIFNPRNDRWTQTGNMKNGRWYPTLTTLANGDQFVVSGVKKLIKPVYTPDPTDPDDEPPVQESGRNVLQTETFNSKTGRWRDNGASARRSLPLFSRTHLLPNGHVYYGAGGQAFNPFGQSPDQATWNMAASYNPATKKWKDLGIPGLTTGPTADPGFRGSTFSIQLPLKPEANGRYTKAEFLTAGGLAAPVTPSPGTYLPVKSSRIATVDTARGDKLTTKPTGSLNEPTPENEPGDLPNGRWYSSGTLLPTGEVLATAGADRDEVAFPGVEHEVKTAELFDPKTKKWNSVAKQHKPRTYHNTAVLLRDGRVLVGGHATITTAYGDNTDVPGSAPNGRDPSFEIYSPPYLFRGARPQIRQADGCAKYGDDMKVTTNTPASQIESVNLVRNTSTTHIVDGDQKTVQLKVKKRQGNTLTVAGPPNGKVAPPGPYMLFVNKRTPKGLIPSVAKQVALGGDACKTFGRPGGPASGGQPTGGDKTAVFDQNGSGGGIIQQNGPGDEYDYHSNGLTGLPAAGDDSGLARTLGGLGLTCLLAGAIFSVARASRRLGWLRRERP